jgi:hypothetical protein
MADTQRTRAAILTLFADNLTGQISAQDLRDYVVTVMESEFANAGDFWKEPNAQYVTTDRTVRGWIDYSQLTGSACSFGNPMMMNASGAWVRLDLTGSDLSTIPRVFGIAADSYLASDPDAQILRRGLIKDSNISAILSDNIGKAIYANSGAAGSITATQPTSAFILGYVEPEGSDYTLTHTDVWRFCSGWSILD